jgi:hypothetical protein
MTTMPRRRGLILIPNVLFEPTDDIRRRLPRQLGEFKIRLPNLRCLRKEDLKQKDLKLQSKFTVFVRKEDLKQRHCTLSRVV